MYYNYCINFFCLFLLTTKTPNLVPGSVSEEFSNGYLLGELLHKYDLQDDFDQFSQSRLVHMDNMSVQKLGKIFSFQVGLANARWEIYLELTKI